MSYEAGILEDPNITPPADMWKLTADPVLSAPDEPEDVTIDFEQGIPVKISSPLTGTKTKPTEVFLAANALGRKHGVGRIDVSVLLGPLPEFFLWYNNWPRTVFSVTSGIESTTLISFLDCREPIHWIEVPGEFFPLENRCSYSWASMSILLTFARVVMRHQVSRSCEMRTSISKV